MFGSYFRTLAVILRYLPLTGIKLKNPVEITIVGKFEGIPLHLLFSYTVSDKIKKLTSKTEIFTEAGNTLETYQLHLFLTVKYRKILKSHSDYTHTSILVNNNNEKANVNFLCHSPTSIVTKTWPDSLTNIHHTKHFFIHMWEKNKQVFLFLFLHCWCHATLHIIIITMPVLQFLPCLERTNTYGTFWNKKESI